jgi:hypothetical protein
MAAKKSGIPHFSQLSGYSVVVEDLLGENLEV